MSKSVSIMQSDSDRYQFFIFPARLERWAEENAIEYR